MWIEWLYAICGLILPLFYVPQLLRFRKDNTLLASYSMSKALAQLLCRLPALLFAFVVVHNTFMNFVLVLDVIGRLAELLAGCYALRRQGMSWRGVGERMVLVGNVSEWAWMHSIIHGSEKDAEEQLAQAQAQEAPLSRV